MPFLSFKSAASGTTERINISMLGLEFVIVFLSVYLAFVLTDYQEGLRENEIRIKYYENLVLELEAITYYLDEEAKEIAVHLAILDEIEEGDKPLIPPSKLYFLFDGGVLDAAIEGGNFEWLDLGVLENITRTMPFLKALEQRVVLLNGLTASLMPLQSEGRNCCYREEGGLLAQMKWYPQLVMEIHTLNRDIHEFVMGSALPASRAEMALLR